MTQEEYEIVELCVSNMTCELCGLELDSDTDCECQCHTMI